LKSEARTSVAIASAKQVNEIGFLRRGSSWEPA
jgi:hypothetical protein